MQKHPGRKHNFNSVPTVDDDMCSLCVCVLWLDVPPRLPSNTPSPENPNFMSVLKIPVDLPANPLFAPVVVGQRGVALHFVCWACPG